MKKIITLLTAVLCMFAIAGCASTASDNSDSASGSSSDNPRHVRVILDWTPNTNHSGIYVALNKGYYKDAGLDVEVLGFSQAGAESVLQHDGADFGISGAELLALADAQGADLTMVYSLQQVSSEGIAVRADADIKSPKDLDGKIFASYGAAENIDKAREMIKKDGGKGEFETVIMGTSCYQAVADGAADFAAGFSTWEGIDFELKGEPLRFMYPRDWGVISSPAEMGLATKRDLIAKDPQLVRDFVQATKKGYDYAIEHPDEASKILVDNAPEAQLNPELVKRSHELLTTKYWPDSTGKTGLADIAAWQKYLDYLTQNGTLVDNQGNPLTTPPVASDLVTNEFVQ